MWLWRATVVAAARRMAHGSRVHAVKVGYGNRIKIKTKKQKFPKG
jgi:hypothetical protein